MHRTVRTKTFTGTLIAASMAVVLLMVIALSQLAGPAHPSRDWAPQAPLPGEAYIGRQIFGSDTADMSRLYRRALDRSIAIEAQTAAEDPELAEASWTLEGPTNIGGRVLDIAVDPELADTIYVAAASGGVWKSTDAGTTFAPAWPNDLTQSIGALEISRSGILYAGTGEAGPGGGSLTYGGTGLYRSTDRGATWEHIGLAGSSRIGRIAIDPSDESRIFVAATGPLYSPGGERGLYLSDDGGDTWNRVLSGDNETTGAVDVVIDPHDPQRIYAAMWDHLREPDRRRYSGLGSGVYRSTDGGATWQRIGLGVFGPRPDISRIGLALAPQKKDLVYAVVTTESGLWGGFYKSTDGGATWSAAPGDANSAGLNGFFVYGWWFGRVWVHPTDAEGDRVYVAGVALLESANGGVSWRTANGGAHVDQHAMAWDPKSPGRVYLGNDGGVYRSDADGASWQFGEYQPWSQLYTFDVSEQEPHLQVAGLQDNGVNRSYQPDGSSGPDRWNEFHGGDGLRASIDPQNKLIVYSCHQYGECTVSHNGGNTNSSFTTEVVSSRKNWLTPIEFDPDDPAIVYSGGEILSRSPNNAADWSVISPDLSNGPGRESNPLFRNFGTITTISAAKKDGVIYVGTDDGNLWTTTSPGLLPGAWRKVSSSNLPKAWITRVEVDNSDPEGNTAYVTYSGYRSGSDAAWVFRTTDGGSTWTEISSGLPPAPVNDINATSKGLVVASDVGVFLSRDLGQTWLKVGSNLPMAPVHELRWHEPSGTLYAGTFGRSAWKVVLP